MTTAHACKNSLHGVFSGLQNCTAILHVAKTRLRALLNYGKEEMSYKNYLCQQKKHL